MYNEMIWTTVKMYNKTDMDKSTDV